MAEAQEGLPQPGQEKGQLYKDFGARCAEISRRIGEEMFGGKNFEQLAREADSATIRSRLEYTEASHVRRGAQLKVPEFENYRSESVIQGLVTARNEAHGLIARVGAKDGSVDEIVFRTGEEADIAIRRLVWLWGREHNIRMTYYPILELATQEQVNAFRAEKYDKKLQTSSGAFFENKITPDAVDSYKMSSFKGFKTTP